MFAQLPTELLAHILRLSNEREGAKEQQRSRFAFGLVSRALYLAAAGTTDFYVAGRPQAVALASKLEREKVWAAQEERKARSGRRTRSGLSITRVSNVCRLSVILDKETNGKVLATLLEATPGLVALELAGTAEMIVELEAQLVTKLEGLLSVRELYLGTSLATGVVHRIIKSLANVEVLDMLELRHYLDLGEDDAELRQVALPHLRVLRLRLYDDTFLFPAILLQALAAGSTAPLRTLSIPGGSILSLTPKTTEPLLPHVANLVRLQFTWLRSTGSVPTDCRDAALALLGAMHNLQNLFMSLWAMDDSGPNPSDSPVDHTVFDTLATLPALKTVKLTIHIGRLDDLRIVAFIQSCPALRTLVIISQVGKSAEWTAEQNGLVKSAGRVKGVAVRLVRVKAGRM
ncbi:hypothetical protein RQP46_003134 [Phenoliferia psychrophenolica]